MQKEIRWKLIGLCALGALLFNFPMIQLFSQKKLVAGIPLLYLYVLVVWLLFIIALYRIIDQPIKDNPSDHSE